jgi:predicted choloylglycine hydrolase
MLTLYNPPPYITGCSQAVHLGADRALVRNYDYAPELFERGVLGSSFTGRQVAGTSDCLWGLVDGMNDAGLAVSLAFGGRPTTGTGFGIPLVLRYVLEVCDSAAQARHTLARLPVHMPYNVTVTDLAGDCFSVFLDPASDPVFTTSPIATNHEPAPAPGNVGAPRSRERWDLLASLVDDADLDLEQLVGRFLEPPLHSDAYEAGFGTLYTAVYRPAELAIEYRWPGSSWKHTIGSFADGQHEVVLGAP